jgi:hypothetical protein
MTFQFQIQIKGVTQPPVWRQLLVPASFNFLQLHKVIQSAFGWKGHHLFHFAARSYDSYQIGVNNDDFGYDVAEADTVMLSEIFAEPGDKFVYVYDFGDDWIHLIKLEKISDEKTTVAQCIAGKGGCPPEDCGGPAGYAEVKKSLKLQGNSRLDELRKWVYETNDGKFDINAFDIEKVNELLSKI